MNNKAILMSETLKIILAVISIGLLVYLAFSLYGIFIKDTRLEQAEATLNQISDYIKSAQEDEETKYMILNPKEWYVVFYDAEEEMPGSCKEKNCLCFCSENTKESCEQGVCKGFDENIKLMTIAFDDNINLKNIPRQIFFKKEQGVITIYTEEKQIKHEGILDDFLNREIIVDNQKIKVYEQMISVVEKRSGLGVENEGHLFFDEDFGARGWCVQYSKEGPTYSWVDLGNCGSIDYKYSKNVETALEKEIPYDEGILKVKFYALKG